MARYYHAHQVVRNKCRGHMTCMRHCPTQAIRVRYGKAVISDELCVDCGECISVCPEGAIIPIADPLAELSEFKYKVVVPAPVLYSQFGPHVHPYVIHQALMKVGFDRVVDVDRSAALLAKAIAKYVDNFKGRKPLISSYCPSIVRLIQVKYPDLLGQLVPLDAPREVAAKEIRRTLPRELDMDPKDIGIVYLVSCPAKIVSIRQPAEKGRSNYDSVISIQDAYAILLPKVRALIQDFDVTQVPEGFTFESGWARTGCITDHVEEDSWLAVSGLDNVMQVLDDIENGRLRYIEFIEAMAHSSGCVGGPFCLENPYVARHTTVRQKDQFEKVPDIDDNEVEERMANRDLFLANPVLPRPMEYFDTDLETSIKRIKERERVFQNLPQIDCGCCGCPTCMTFAEDFVRGEVELTDCVFLSGRAKRAPAVTDPSVSQSDDQSGSEAQ
ncbi:hypothetical protein GF377_01450 [candidate division GN15 bacterium]|nr:hypothetical protein [candidate division GN15 bacterium]